MKVLSIETATERGSVAVLHDGKLLARRVEGAANHSEAILRDVRALLAEAGLGVGDLEAVAFGAGPGAFTGVRLACGIAQGIALAADVGVAAVGSLQALALQTGAARAFVATDARMGEIYCGAFEADTEGVPAQIGALRCIAPVEVELPAGNWFAVGSAFKVWPEVLQERFMGRLLGCAPEHMPRAEEVARLAAVAAARGELLAAEHAAPLYVRDKVAFTTAERLARGGRA